MRFEEGLAGQFVSTQKTLTPTEKNDLIRDYKSVNSDLIQIGFKKLKNELKGDDLEDIYSNDEQKALVQRAEQIARNSSQASGAGAEAQNKKKASKIPLIIFIVMLIAVIGTAVSGHVVACIGVFLLGFSFFGFYSVYQGNNKGYTHYEGNNARASKSAGLIMGIVGLAAAIPLMFAGVLGMGNALTLMAIVLFAVVGLMMLIGFFKSNGLKDKKYTQEVSAECVGYVRNVELRTSHTNGTMHRYYVFETSPIFEYEYQGKSYKGVYDRMFNGVDADVDLGPLTISIDPANPEDIYRKATEVKRQGLIISLICFVVAIAMAIVFFTSDRLADERQLTKNLQGVNIVTLLFGSEEEKKEAMEKLGNSGENSIPAEITDEFVEEVAAKYGYDGKEWFYELEPVVKVEEFEDGSYNIYFEDETMPVMACSGNHDDVGDTRIVFYTLDEMDLNGEHVVLKNIFWDVSPDGHTYVGSHGAA